MRRNRLFAPAFLLAPLTVMAGWSWVTSAIADPCCKCLTAPNATCSGTSSTNCLGSGCDYCSSGCATISGLTAKQCGLAESGGFNLCYPQYTSCGSFSKEVTSPCNWACLCDTGTVYYADCAGAFQTSCNLNAPCDVPIGQR